MKAVIFDCDGLLADTETPDFEAWQHIYEEFGTSLTLEEWKEVIGGSRGDFDPYAILEERSGRSVSRPEVRSRHRQIFAELTANQGLRPGIQDRLNEAARLGLRLAVASSSTREWVQRQLQRLDVSLYFEVVGTQTEVGGVTKPDPAVYQWTMQQLGLPSTDALALEDSANGLFAAKEAGLLCVVVPTALTRDMAFEKADLVVNAATDFTFKELAIRWWNA